MKRMRLGEMLLEAQLIDQATIDKAEKLQKTNGLKFGQTLIAMNAVDERKLLTLLSTQLKIPFVDLNTFNTDPNLVELLPEQYARRYCAVILKREDKSFLVGMADPLDINAFDMLSKILKNPIKMAIVSESLLLNVLDRIYLHDEEISLFAQKLSKEVANEIPIDKIDTLLDDSLEEEDQSAVVQFLNALFKEALQLRASDIHLEPDVSHLRVRFRINGVLQEMILKDKQILDIVIRRLKLRARLDISEQRLPQDGRFNFSVKDHAFDVRLSTIPTANGESLVMRLLDQSMPINDLSQLGIPLDMLVRIEKIYTRPYGMLLVTGPTGSGKTTTLYSILSRLNITDRKIITVEDPVEYTISHINQIQVNPKIDLTFASVLRAILRQDPDVIMVGEIRDVETAQIAMRAAMTGHFVLATLHTNNAASTAIRLVDMGVEGYMVASAVKAILGQRLIRILCTGCMSQYTPTEIEKNWLTSVHVDLNTPFKNSTGCDQCSYSGYINRAGVYELLELNEGMLTALRTNNAVKFAKEIKICKTYQPLMGSVLQLLKAGKTSIAESIRVVGQIDEN